MEKMKNVFILSTDKESNLFKNLNSDLEVKETSLGNRFEVNQFVYVTNEDKIEDEECCITFGSDTCKGGLDTFYSFVRYSRKPLKIVLTNDPTLIADGVQEIEKSVLISFAENPVDYVEVTQELKAFDDQNREIDFAMEKEDYTKTVYSVNFPQKSLEQIVGEAMFKQADFVYQPQTQIVKLLNEFEILEGITPEQFDEKDWARFERFVKSRTEENKTGEALAQEKLYTQEQLGEAFNVGRLYQGREGDTTFEQWFEKLKKKNKIW